MSLRYWTVLIISLGLAVLALVNGFWRGAVSGQFHLAYLGFGFLGLVGSIFAIAKKAAGRWLLLAFYSMQLVIASGDSWQIGFNPGLRFYVFLFSSEEPNILGVNLLAILMLILVYKYLRLPPERVA